MQNKPTVIDFFCGCGGLSKGFMDAGYEVLLGIDNDEVALKTFVLNHKNSEGLALDLSKPNILDSLVEKLDGKNPDVIVGGPPCQGFSLTGTRNFEDKRNSLYLSMIEAIKIIRPKAFLIENVPGLAKLYGGKVKDEIIKRLSEFGYNVSMNILCAADYGVPQVRKRVFFVGLENSLGEFQFPKPTHTKKNYISCEEAIGDLPPLIDELGNEKNTYLNKPTNQYASKMRGNQKILLNHIATNHKDFVKEVINMVPDGGNHKDLPEGIGTSRKFNEAWTRYHSKSPSKTIDTGHRNHFHYRWNRIPTVRENARLQSFPDNFEFLGTRTAQYRQVGNAVPPLLAFTIAEELLKYI